MPPGGSWGLHGRGRDAAEAARPRTLGYAYLHTILGARSSLTYTEIFSDEKGTTAVAFWARAHDGFASCGIVIARCLRDNHISRAPTTLPATSPPGSPPAPLTGDPALPVPDQR